MKHWIWYLAALALITALGIMPFSGTDVAKLQPVELIRVTYDQGKVVVETDTGDLGIGTDLKIAFADLKKTTAGEVFLETAEYLILSTEAVALLPDLTEYLRPACGICIEIGKTDLEQAAPFLANHTPNVTLRDHRAGETEIPMLLTKEGRMHLVQ